MEAEDRHDIMEVGIFVDSKGREVKRYRQMFGKTKKPDFFMGTATMRVKMASGIGGQEVIRDIPVDFPYPDGTMLKGAFETFDAEANKAVAEYAKVQKERAAASKVVAAKTIPKLQILGADGKPAAGG